MKRLLIVISLVYFTVNIKSQPTFTVGFLRPLAGVTNYVKLTDALKKSSSGSEIWVARGQYSENELIIAKGVTVIGGFKDSATTIADRIYPGSATDSQLSVLSGSNKHRVATVYGTLDGFSIQNGFAWDSVGSHVQSMQGGGVYIDGGKVLNCLIHKNTSSKSSPSASTIPSQYVAHIGDIYCTDGTILSPVYTMSQTTGLLTATLSSGIPSGKIPQGIIFYVDPAASTGRFYVMAKVSSKSLAPWFNPTFDFPLTNITTESQALADFNGKANSVALNQQFAAWHSANPYAWYDGWDDDNPVPYCLNYDIPTGTKGDWYLPAAGEIYKLWEVYIQMDACARDVLGWIGSGESMFVKSVLWTSSEYDSNNVWTLALNSYPWGDWGVKANSKTGGGYAIPVTCKTLISK